MIYLDSSALITLVSGRRYAAEVRDFLAAQPGMPMEPARWVSSRRSAPSTASANIPPPWTTLPGRGPRFCSPMRSGTIGYDAMVLALQIQSPRGALPGSHHGGHQVAAQALVVTQKREPSALHRATFTG